MHLLFRPICLFLEQLRKILGKVWIGNTCVTVPEMGGVNVVQDNCLCVKGVFFIIYDLLRSFVILFLPNVKTFALGIKFSCYSEHNEIETTTTLWDRKTLGGVLALRLRYFLSSNRLERICSEDHALMRALQNNISLKEAQRFYSDNTVDPQRLKVTVGISARL